MKHGVQKTRYSCEARAAIAQNQQSRACGWPGFEANFETDSKITPYYLSDDFELTNQPETASWYEATCSSEHIQWSYTVTHEESNFKRYDSKIDAKFEIGCRHILTYNCTMHPH